MLLKHRTETSHNDNLLESENKVKHEAAPAIHKVKSSLRGDWNITVAVSEISHSFNYMWSSGAQYTQVSSSEKKNNIIVAIPQ